uniref:Type-2 ice-structuring protein-like n=1 Tax=Poecilia formosa TaxID=48698 RepID=A0A096LQ95_POEFO
MKLLAVFLLVFSMMALTSGDSLHYSLQKRIVLHKKSFSCPCHWSQINGRCFIFVAKPMTWAKAEKNCLSMGANLASVRNIKEYRQIQGLILAAGYETRETWIGGSDAQEDRTWLWSDGSALRFTNWCPKQPDNLTRKQECLQMNYSAGKCWDDTECSAKKPSVCVKKSC